MFCLNNLVDWFVWRVVCFWQRVGGRSFHDIQRMISMLGFSAGLLKDQKPAVHLPFSTLKNIFSSLKNIFSSLKNIFLTVSLLLKQQGGGIISMKNCRNQGCQKLQVLVRPNPGREGKPNLKTWKFKTFKNPFLWSNCY